MKIVIGIKYCGGCNPHIDRTRLARIIRQQLTPEYIITTDQSSPWDIGILICGCPTACADRQDFKNLARTWIVAVGKSVNHGSAPEKELAEIVLNKLKL